MGDDEVLEAEAQLYQRLLARDQPEARGIVDTFQKENSLIELYDSVLIPALSLAEQDRHNGTIDGADATHAGADDKNHAITPG